MCPNCTCEDCKPTPETVLRLKAEIEALKARNDSLRKAIASMPVVPHIPGVPPGGPPLIGTYTDLTACRPGCMCSRHWNPGVVVACDAP